jgi:hypothetical protein
MKWSAGARCRLSAKATNNTYAFPVDHVRAQVYDYELP